MRRFLKWLLIAFCGLLFLVSVVTWLSYYGWRGDRLDQLATGGQVVDTAAGPIEYVLHGDSGPIMLFLHGSPGGYDAGPSTWQHFRILVPSRPGYLATPLSAGETPEQQAHAYAALLDELGIDDQVLVVATSGGGPSGIAFAALYPEKTAALIALVAVSQATSDLPPVPGFMRSDFLFWAMLSSIRNLLGDEGLVSIMIPDPANRQRILSDPESIEAFVPVLWNIWPLSLRSAGFENDLQQYSQMALPIDQIAVPTLIVHGTADASVPHAQSEILADRIPGSQLLSIEGADHMVSFTHREEIETEMSRFFREFDLDAFIE